MKTINESVRNILEYHYTKLQWKYENLSNDEKKVLSEAEFEALKKEFCTKTILYITLTNNKLLVVDEAVFTFSGKRSFHMIRFRIDGVCVPFAHFKNSVSEVDLEKIEQFERDIQKNNE